MEMHGKWKQNDLDRGLIKGFGWKFDPISPEDIIVQLMKLCNWNNKCEENCLYNVNSVNSNMLLIFICGNIKYEIMKYQK